MENRTKGAWIINHTKKLQDFSETANFEDIQLAGKCGIFLSNLAATNEESQITKEKVAGCCRIRQLKLYYKAL